MKFAILSLFFLLMLGGSTMKIDFGKGKAGQDWQIINDGVMGGLSKGKVTFEENSLLFEGKVSLANNGGFTSFKSPYQRFDLSSYKKVRVRMKSTGQTLAMTLEVDRRWYFPYFKHKLITASEDWQVIEIDLAEFKQYQIGRYTGNRLTTDSQAAILRMGFTTDTKKEGPFEAEIDYIEFL